MAHVHTDAGSSSAPAPIQVRVLRVKAGETISVRTLSSEIGGIFTHFVRDPGKKDQGRSHYCCGEDCPRDLHRLEAFWKGYAGVEMYDQFTQLWLPFVLEVTEHCEQDMAGIFARNQGWELTRTIGNKRQKHGPVKARLVSSNAAAALPPSFDIARVLCHVYHVRQIVFGAQNPLPPRLFLSPTPKVDSPPRKEP